MTRICVATSYRNPLVVLALLGVACAHPSEAPRWARLGSACPAHAPAVELPAALRDSLRGAGTESRATIHDRWAEAARELPGGIAGELLAGGLVVFLVDTDPRDA